MKRDPSVIVVVADVADLWALERASALNARYHVLGGTLSPLDGVGPQDLTIDALVARAHDPAVKEVVLALNATVDGQTTAHYITDLLHNANVIGDAARARRAGRRRARLSRRGHAVAGFAQPHADVSQSSPAVTLTGPRLLKCPRACSHHSRNMLGIATSALIAKNHAQPVSSAR